MFVFILSFWSRQVDVSDNVRRKNSNWSLSRLTGRRLISGTRGSVSTIFLVTTLEFRVPWMSNRAPWSKISFTFFASINFIIMTITTSSLSDRHLVVRTITLPICDQHWQIAGVRWWYNSRSSRWDLQRSSLLYTCLVSTNWRQVMCCAFRIYRGEKTINITVSSLLLGWLPVIIIESELFQLPCSCLLSWLCNDVVNGFNNMFYVYSKGLDGRNSSFRVKSMWLLDVLQLFKSVYKIFQRLEIDGEFHRQPVVSSGSRLVEVLVCWAHKIQLRTV